MPAIQDVDTADEPRLHEWYDAWRAAQPHRPADLIPSWEASRVPLATRRSDFDVTLLGLRDDDGVLAGTALLNVPLDDNLTVAYADLMVPPGHRRRGHGTTLLHELERRARDAGRERLLTEVYVPPGGEEGNPDLAFAGSRGYAVANRESMKAVDLADADARWPALAEEAAAARGDYRVVTWRDACPEQYVESFGRALSRVMSLIPQGDLDLEDRDWTVDRVRRAERHRVDIGLVTVESAAIAPDGEVAGLTGVRTNRDHPRVAHVGVTMVLPEHRGHRLGLATKLDSHRALRADVPGCHLVVTSNAEVNVHMNAINEAMGYRRLETLVELHRSI
jgi:GNAT superfamily N-acetyltransferase